MVTVHGADPLGQEKLDRSASSHLVAIAGRCVATRFPSTAVRRTERTEHQLRMKVGQASEVDGQAQLNCLDLDAVASGIASTAMNPNPQSGDPPTPRSAYSRSAGCSNVASLLGVKIDSCPSSSQRTR